MTKVKTSPLSEKSNARSESTRARETLTRLLSIRDHSRRELKQKLSRKYSAEATAEALEWAENHQLLREEAAISQVLSQQLDRQLKSHRQIGAQLMKKGLPPQKANRDLELEKIRRLLGRKFRQEVTSGKKFSYEEKIKAYRFLKNRGFSDSLIKIALNESPNEG